MARPKIYIIKLSDEERAELQKTICNKKTSKTVLKRCQILLELDENYGPGLTHAQIAHRYAVCPATSVPIPVPHGANWTGAMRRASSRWPAALFRKDIPVGL